MERVLNRTLLKSLALFICLLALTQTSQATTVVIPLDDDMIIGARAIVKGKVVSIESSLDPQRNRIFTYITVKVKEVIKGQITERKIVLKEMGGQVGDRTEIIYGNPRFKKGEKVILYLDTWADGSLRTYQMFLGKFDIVKDPVTGEAMAVRSAPDDNTLVLTPDVHAHSDQGQSTERMELSSYVRMVQNRLAANWDRAVQFDAEAYKNIPVLPRPAEYESITGSGDFYTDFSFLNNLRFFEPDSGQPVLITLNPNASSESGVPALVLNSADVTAAGNAWSNVTGSNFRMSYSGPLNQCYTDTALPGVHVVSNNCDGRNGPTPGCASILAWGGAFRTGGLSQIINGVNFRQTTMGFVSMNPWSCSFTSSCRVQEVLTHEIGHAIGLGHSQSGDATMAPVAHFDGRCASIRADDENGLRAIYPGTNEPGPLTITTSTLSSGTVNQSYSQTVSASGGSTPYTWSLDTGSTPLPPGLSLNSSGLISGTPTTAGTYDFTVKVTDNASATATKLLSITIGQAGSQPYSAQFVSQSSIPTTLTPGQTFNVNLKFMNNGTQTWSGTSLFYLASQNPPLNQVWGGNGVDLNYWGFLPIAPGQTLNIDLQFNAPTTPGTYNFQWQMYRNDGVTNFFGQTSQNVAIQVGSAPPPPPPTNNASFVSQNAPTSMTTGQVVQVSVTMQNTGTTTWSPGTYFLGSQNPQDNTTWGFNRVNLPSSVAPNGQVTFTFNVTAPSSAGAYNFQWRLLQGSNSYFGTSSSNMSVNVSSPPSGGTGANTIGCYRPSNSFFYLRNSNSSGAANQTFGYGPSGAGWIGIVGDWNGDGVDTAGLYNPATSTFFLKNTNAGGSADVVFSYGPGGLGWLPIAGDWDGNGTDTVGLYNPATSTFYLRNTNAGGNADVVFGYGPAGAGWVPVVGDWDGNGTDTAGLYSPGMSTFFLKNANAEGAADVVFGYGPAGAGWVAIAGDWNGDGADTVGLYSPATSSFYLRNTNTAGAADITFSYGSAGDKPLAGKWN